MGFWILFCQDSKSVPKNKTKMIPAQPDNEIPTDTIVHSSRTVYSLSLRLHRVAPQVGNQNQRQTSSWNSHRHPRTYSGHLSSVCSLPCLASTYKGLSFNLMLHFSFRSWSEWGMSTRYHAEKVIPFNIDVTHVLSCDASFIQKDISGVPDNGPHIVSVWKYNISIPGSVDWKIK